MTQCPKCGGAVYDNRADKASGKRNNKWPDFKCRDKNCNWAQWPEKGSAGAPARTANSGGKWTWDGLSATYRESLRRAAKHVPAMAAVHKIPFTTADILAAAATIFIAATRDGIRTAKPVAAPEPAPLPPEPEDLPDELPDDDEDPLPF